MKGGSYLKKKDGALERIAFTQQAGPAPRPAEPAAPPPAKGAEPKPTKKES